MNLAFWKRPQRKQLCLRLCEDDHIRLEELPMFEGYVVDDREQAAWFNPRSHRVPLEKGEGRTVLVISERDAVPLNPYVELNEKEEEAVSDTRPIARLAYYRASSEGLEDRLKGKLASAMVFIGLLMGIVFVVVIILGVMR